MTISVDMYVIPFKTEKVKAEATRIGLAEGLAEGRAEGRAEVRSEMVRKMVMSGMPREKVAEILEVSLEEIDKMLQQ